MTVTINVPPEKEDAWKVHVKARGLSVEEWLRELADQAAEEPLPTKKSAAEIFANAKGLGEDLDVRRNPSYGRDGLIAATAFEHSLTIVTRNVRDFDWLDVPVLNPWQ